MMHLVGLHCWIHTQNLSKSIFMSKIKFTDLYRKVKEYGNGKHWIDIYNAWKLRNADQEIKEALYMWLEDGMPSLTIYGVTFSELINSDSMNPIQAFLFMDWLKREPINASRFMSEEKDGGSSIKLKESDIVKLADFIKRKGGNPTQNPYLNEDIENDQTDINL